MLLENLVSADTKEEQAVFESGTTPRVPEPNAEVAQLKQMRSPAEVVGLLARPTNRFDHSGREMPVVSPQGS